jgi:protease-4
MQELVEDTYELFVERVAAGRKMTPAAVKKIAQGRVWTGTQALDVGLVDELGGLHAAVERARSALGIAADADIALIPYPQAPTLADQIREAMGARISDWLESSVLSSLVDASAPPSRALRELRAFVGLMPVNQPLALAPLLPDIR